MGKQLKMTPNIWYVCLTGLFWLGVCLQESLLRMFISDSTISGRLLGMAFAVAFALAAVGVAALLPPLAARVWIVLVHLLTAFFFISQLVYHHIFGTFYTIYSLLGGAQVLQFHKQIGGTVAACIWQIALLLLPLLWTLALVTFMKAPMRHSRAGIFMLFLTLLAHGAALILVPLFGTGGTTPHRYYYNALSIGPTACALGLMNSFRLDAEHTLFGFPLAEQTLSFGTEIPSQPEQGSLQDYPANVLPIDFQALIENESQSEVRELHQIFSARQPTLQNEMTGIYKGYNLIYITAESFSPYAIDETLTPTLYKMANQGYRFTNFYNPIWGVSTTDGE